MIFDQNLQKAISIFIYRSKHIALFTIFGIIAVASELILKKILVTFNITELISILISVILGILIAFYLNVNFNFYIPTPKRFKSAILFIFVSIFSIGFQFLVKKNFDINILNYSQERFLYAGFFFLIAYFLHLKISFKDYRKVAVAIYMNKKEDIKKIFDKVGFYPDFIHIDVVDESFNKNAVDSSLERLEVVKAYWPNKKIEVHLMSKNPTNIIKNISKFSDVIYVHKEINEDLNKVLLEIKNQGCEPGLVLHAINNYNNLDSIINNNIKYILVLTVKEPGYSGQKFMEESFFLIDKINKLPNRNRISLCIDGGINNENVNLIDAEKLTSGSSVLEGSSPIRNLLFLQAGIGNKFAKH